MSGLSFLFRNGSRSLSHRERRIDALVRRLALRTKEGALFDSVNQAYEGVLLGLRDVTRQQKHDTLFDHLKIIEPDARPIEVFQQLSQIRSQSAGVENKTIAGRLQTPRFENLHSTGYDSFISTLSPNDSSAIDWKAVMTKYQTLPFPAPLFIKPNDFERFLLKLKIDEGLHKYLPASSVQKVMEDMEAARMSMTSKELNHLLRMCLASIHVEQSMDKLYKFMTKQKQKDIASYCVFLNRAIELDDREMIARVLKDVDSIKTLKPNRFLYGLLAKYACERKDLDLLLSIHELGCLSFLDAVHLDHLIKAFAECGFISAAEETLCKVVLPLTERCGPVSDPMTEFLMLDRNRKLYNHKISLIENASNDLYRNKFPLFLFKFQPLPSMFSCIIKCYSESLTGGEAGKERVYNQISSLMHLMLERNVPIHHFCWNYFFASFRQAANDDSKELSFWLATFLNAKRKELLFMDGQPEISGTFLKFTPELLANIFQSFYLVSRAKASLKSMITQTEKSVGDIVKYVKCSEYKNSTFRKMARRDQLILELLEKANASIQ